MTCWGGGTFFATIAIFCVQTRDFLAMVNPDPSQLSFNFLSKYLAKVARGYNVIAKKRGRKRNTSRPTDKQNL